MVRFLGVYEENGSNAQTYSDMFRTKRRRVATDVVIDFKDSYKVSVLTTYVGQYEAMGAGSREAIHAMMKGMTCSTEMSEEFETWKLEQDWMLTLPFE